MISAGRIAALYDVHGNLPALTAVLDEISQEQIDLIVVGGDVVPGPMPRQTLDRLLSIGLAVEFIRGNGEVALLDEIAGRKARVPEAVRDSLRWTGEQLTAEQQTLLGKWPRTLTVNLAGLGDVLFCHATPRDEDEIFTRLTSPARLRLILEGVAASLVVCGHTHMQFDLTLEGTRIGNAGSVGMPFAQPGAYWLLLGPGPGIEFRRTEYDLESAARDISLTKYPQAQEFAESNVLRPPTEAEMLKLLEPAAGLS